MNVSVLSVVDWQNVVNAIPCLYWGIIGLAAIVYFLRPLSVIWIKNHHERMMKEDVFEREKQWADFEKIKASTDEELKKENEGLKNQYELEKQANELLKKQLEVYQDLYNKFKD